jgi:dihydroorotate dehydrogenase (NAD+) catalytic subunit
LIEKFEKIEIQSKISAMVNLNVDFCGVKFENPLVLASGVLGVTAGSLARVVELGAGGVTTKSLWRQPHPGHKNPVMFGTEHYFMNAVGLSDAGLEKGIETLTELKEKTDAPLIANIVAAKIEDFGSIAESIDILQPDIIEINISCPNVESELGKPFACSRTDAAAVTKIVRSRTRLPLAVKLSPNVENIVDIAKSVVDAGANAITAINTVGPGMRWNIDLCSPMLANRVGGISGPAIFPIAVKSVFDIHAALPNTPIIATGGINSGRDVLEIMMAGGTLAGVGTALYYHGDDFWKNAKAEITEWLDENNFKNISEVIGIFHKK